MRALQFWNGIIAVYNHHGMRAIAVLKVKPQAMFCQQARHKLMITFTVL
ncbi:hypothetical protein VINE108274_24045 [Vibrio neptunius]